MQTNASQCSQQSVFGSKVELVGLIRAKTEQSLQTAIAVLRRCGFVVWFCAGSYYFAVSPVGYVNSFVCSVCRAAVQHCWIVLIPSLESTLETVDFYNFYSENAENVGRPLDTNRCSLASFWIAPNHEKSYNTDRSGLLHKCIYRLRHSDFRNFRQNVEYAGVRWLKKSRCGFPKSLGLLLWGNYMDDKKGTHDFLSTARNSLLCCFF